jgi:hypothetical protein
MTDDAVEDVSFELHVQDLFTQRDQEAMLLQFDLWDVDDVRENADRILDVLSSGRMPCYGAWSADDVVLFRRWYDAGMPE